jgi:hypothetical protein
MVATGVVATARVPAAWAGNANRVEIRVASMNAAKSRM